MVDEMQLGRSPGSQLIMLSYLPHNREWHTMRHSLDTVAGPRGFSVSRAQLPYYLLAVQQHQAEY